MPRLVTKFGYLKQGKRRSPGGYARYIATREGVEKLTDSPQKTYADYIATRPRAERLGSHGLFTDEGEPVVLSRVSKELNEYKGNIYTAIVSLRREDAERLGYDSALRWRDFQSADQQVITRNPTLEIPIRSVPLQRIRMDNALTAQASLRLLQNLSKTIEQKYQQEQREDSPVMDRKQRQELTEKRQALGLRG